MSLQKVLCRCTMNFNLSICIVNETLDSSLNKFLIIFLLIWGRPFPSNRKWLPLDCYFPSTNGVLSWCFLLKPRYKFTVSSYKSMSMCYKNCILGFSAFNNFWSAIFFILWGCGLLKFLLSSCACSSYFRCCFE